MTAHEEPEKSTHIGITVQDEDSKEPIYFTIKATTRLGKVFTRYNAIKGVKDRTYTFELNGRFLNEDDTPADYEMVNGDVIGANLHQYGG